MSLTHLRLPVRRSNSSAAPVGHPNSMTQGLNLTILTRSPEDRCGVFFESSNQALALESSRGQQLEALISRHIHGIPKSSRMTIVCTSIGEMVDTALAMEAGLMQHTRDFAVFCRRHGAALANCRHSLGVSDVVDPCDRDTGKRNVLQDVRQTNLFCGPHRARHCLTGALDPDQGMELDAQFTRFPNETGLRRDEGSLAATTYGAQSLSRRHPRTLRVLRNFT